MSKIKSILGNIIIPIALVVFLSISAFASSYSSTFEFSKGLQTQTRYFNGQNIEFSATSDQDWQCATNNYYSVTLRRSVNWGVDTTIGTVSNMPRVGYGSAQWSNVGAGNYYFNLSKANDGVTIHSDNVVMRNY